jgi:signal transduction histidine kinase
VLGRHIEAAMPGWSEIAPRIPVAGVDDERRAPATLPLEVPRGEAWISIAGVRFDEGIVYAFRDVTDEQRVDRLRSEIVATVSHELRTPLTSIYGMAITLQRKDAGIEGEAREQMLDLIVDQSARLGAIIDDILVASRLESGPFEVAKDTIAVRRITQDAVDVLRSDLPDGIELVLEPGPELEAWADAERLRQVLANILENAVKYSPDGGRITVRLTSSDESVCVSVTDEGLGIPPEERERVFDRFHRLDPSMNRGIPGTGLGLYISRELVRRMQGELSVESTLGVGSTFTVSLVRAGQDRAA